MILTREVLVGTSSNTNHAPGSATSNRFLITSYMELRRLANAIVRRERANGDMQPTALVHEAAVRLLQRSPTHFNDRQHFVRTMIREIRCVIIDAVRRRQTAQKHLQASQSEASTTTDETFDPVAIVALEEALTKLQRLDPEKARIAELRLLGGLNHAEIAAILDIPQRTVERRWAFARSRLALLLESSFG